MKAIASSSEMLQMLCKLQKKFGIFFSGAAAFETREPLIDKIEASAPWIKTLENRWDVLTWGQGFLFFDTEEEMWKVFRETNGDDTAKPGEVSIFMLTCSSDGVLWSENT